MRKLIYMRYASLDFGSNSTLLLVVHSTEEEPLVENEELFRTTRLASGIDKTGYLDPDGIRRSLDAAREFLNHLEAQQGPTKGIAAATSAVRDAVNRDLFLAQTRELLGNPPVLLSGDAEARTIFAGATSDLEAGLPSIVLDIGGGSTEFALGTPGNCESAASVNAGCVRLAERFGLMDAADTAAVNAARQYVRTISKKMKLQVSDGLAKTGLQPTPAVVVTGGTATTLAAYQQKLTTYDRGIVHGFQSSENRVSEILNKLQRMPAAERAKLPGIPTGRAPVWPAGLIIMSEMLRCFDVSNFRVSTRGLRFGLIQRLIARELPPTWRTP